MRGFYITPTECITRQEAQAWFEEHNMHGDIDLCIAILNDDDNTAFAAWRCLNKKTMRLLPAFKAPELQPQTAGEIAKVSPVEEDDIFISQRRYYTIRKGELKRIEAVYNEDIIYQIATLLAGGSDNVAEFHFVRVYPKNNGDATQVVCWAWQDENGNLCIHPVFMDDEEIIAKNLDNLQCDPMFSPGDIFERDGFIWRTNMGEYGMEIVPFVMGGSHVS